MQFVFNSYSAPFMNSSESSTTKLPYTLSHRQLTVGLVLLTLIPFLFVVALYMSIPTTKDPLLEVQMEVQSRPWQTNTGDQTRLLPSLVVRNPTDQIWNNVNFSINGQFYYYHPSQVKPSEELVIPLKFFHTKGNQFFPPESQPLRKLTAYAQIPNGARAIKEVSGDAVWPNRN
jgi:hypothetical protein